MFTTVLTLFCFLCLVKIFLVGELSQGEIHSVLIFQAPPAARALALDFQLLGIFYLFPKNPFKLHYIIKTVFKGLEKQKEKKKIWSKVHSTLHLKGKRFQA